MAGRPDHARAEYLAAAGLATSNPEQRYLHDKAAALGAHPSGTMEA